MYTYKDKRLKDKVAIVTGSARGIGKGIATRFAQEGAKLIINDIKEEEGLKTTEEMKKLGADAVFVKADISLEDDIKRMMAKTIETFGKLDILVNNAGVSVSTPIEECSIEDYNFVHNTDLRGLWLCCREAIKLMKKNKGGKIINIASISGVLAPFKNQTIYCAAKGGVIQLTRSIAVEVCKYNINVNSIAPSYINTPIFDEIGFSLKNKENLESLTCQEPIGRVGTIEECGAVAFFLASEDSNYVMGQTIFADGGLISW